MQRVIFIILLTLSTFAYSQTPTDWAWLYGASNAAATSITTTPNGDMYVFGRFYETATFGNKTITSAGSTDVFIAKINAAGSLVWLKQMGSANIERAYAINAHKTSIYIYGGFDGILPLGNDTLISKGSFDAFVGKLDTAGNFIWARSGGSAGKEFIYSKGMTLDKSGNVYITGDMWSNQPVVFGNKTIAATPYGGFFVVKYNAAGNTEWAVCGAVDSGSSAAPLGIKADENDNIYITGGYGGKLTFGTTTLTGYGDDAFLVKYNPAGNVVWATTIGGNSRTTGTAVCCDRNNNVFVTGEADGDLTFGNIKSYGSVAGKNTELFLAKYDSTGNALWAKRAGTHGNSPLFTISADIISDDAGCVYWTGMYYDTLDFYSGGIKAQSLSSGGNVFVAKHDANGNTLWALDGGGRMNDEAMALYLSNQSLYVAGSFWTGDSTRFGSHIFNAVNPNNQENLFIAKIANVTGINPMAKSHNSISIYPNPTENYIIVSGVAKGAIISVYDATGRCMQTHIAGVDNERIETKRLLKGNYTVVVTHPKELGTSYYRLTKL